jgi:transcriptional regulator with XRE-family HTH domain
MSSAEWPEYLDACLQAKCWTPRQLARSSGVSESRVSAWKNQGVEPKIASARAAAKALGVPLVSFLVGAGVLTEEEARPGLAAYSGRELLSEIERRINACEAQYSPREL